MSGKESKNLKPRPPIVVILGHVDHGKTSILDYIRKTKVVEKESGGITQHIGAYQIEVPQEPKSRESEANRGIPRQAQDDFAAGSRKITFIDTPGHEAFSAMRSRGAKVADIAILVVAADEGVKPQTKEAINHILRLNLPLIVAINKMDKPGALPDKVKKELADNDVLVESLGGKVPSVFVSAKTGLGINEFLEMILLVAEMENFNADYLRPATGIIIESKIDPQRGATATLLVLDGILKNKDVVAAESVYGQIKTMENFLGQPTNQAPPSAPVLITGFDRIPPVGEEWQVMASLEEAKNKTEIKAGQEKRKREPAEVLDIGPEQKVFNIILKADVSGSLEAIREMLKSVPQQEIILRVIKAEIGDIVESDIKLAEGARAKIYGFRVKCPAPLDELGKRRGIKISSFDIIYELIQTIRQDASALLKPEISQRGIGRVKILEVFKIKGHQQIIGGRVASGKIERGALADIFRNEERVGSGKITQLQQNKENVAEVSKDRECGIMFEGEPLIEQGDILEIYKEEKKKREL
jgi:translation initiation factor IF-2